MTLEELKQTAVFKSVYDLRNHPQHDLRSVTVFYSDAAAMNDDEGIILTVRLFWDPENRLWRIVSRSELGDGIPYIVGYTRFEEAEKKFMQLIRLLDADMVRLSRGLLN